MGDNRKKRTQCASRQVRKNSKTSIKTLIMMPIINKSDMEGMMEAIEEYLRSCQGIVKAPLLNLIRKTIIVQTYRDYLKCTTSDDEMIDRMLHLPADKNKMHNNQSAQSVTQCKTEYAIDNRTVYDILNQIFKDSDLYPYIKQHKSNRNGRGAFYAIHSRLLGPNHVNATASEAEMALQMSMYDGEKKAWS